MLELSDKGFREVIINILQQKRTLLKNRESQQRNRKNKEESSRNVRNKKISTTKIKNSLDGFSKE